MIRQASLDPRLRDFLSDTAADQLAYPDKADRPWKYVIIHHSATAEGDYAQIDRDHRKRLGYDGCGYHFVIGNGTTSGDGQIEVASRWNQQKPGIHCRNAQNHDFEEYGVGVCLIGNFDKAPPTPRQMEALKALTAYLEGRYNIRPSRVATHTRVAATPTVCPGRFFPDDSARTSAKAAYKESALRASWVPASTRGRD